MADTSGGYHEDPRTVPLAQNEGLTVTTERNNEREDPVQNGLDLQSKAAQTEDEILAKTIEEGLMDDGTQLDDNPSAAGAEQKNTAPEPDAEPDAELDAEAAEAERQRRIDEEAMEDLLHDEDDDALPGAKEKFDPTIWRNAKKLSKYLGLASVQEMEDWFASDTFKFAWEDLYEDWIKPQQEAADAEGTQRKRGPPLPTIEQELACSEAAGLRKYSRNRVDKTDWDEQDHYAFFLHRIRNENIDDRHGLFYGKGLSDGEINQRIWQALQRITYNSAPSRKKKSVKSIPKKINRAQAPDTSTPAKRKALEAAKTSTAGTSMKSSAKTTTKGDGRKAGVVKASTEAPVPEDVDLAYLDETYPEEEAANVEDDIPLEHFLSASTSDAGALEVMKWEATSKDMNLDDRYWQYELIKTLVQNPGGIRNIVSVKDRELEEKYLEHLNAESVTWSKEAEASIAAARQKEKPDEDDQIISVSSANREDIEIFKHQEEWLDNVDYQREDHLDACKLLNIKNPNVPRIQGMLRSVWLKFWQPVGIKALYDFEANPHLRAAIVADVVGLGKTWIVIGKLLEDLNIRRRAIRAREADPTLPALPKAKPTVVILPPNLVAQWASEFSKVTDQFRVFVYHRDVREKTPIPGAKRITGKLTLSHPLLQDKEENSNVVIITTYLTLNHRHGPAELKKWRKNTKHMTTKEAGEVFLEVDPEWEGFIGDAFRIAVLDEAHSIKNDGAHTSTAVSWLKAEFHVLLTATPLSNHVRDFRGYMNLIEQPYDESIWEGSAAFKYEKGQDPYDLQDDHPAAFLQLTRRGLEKYVLADNVDEVRRGAKIATIWRKCLLRRTYASRIPFKTGRTIGSSMPPLHTQILEMRYRDEAQALYDEYQEKPSRGLVIKRDDGTISFSASNHRLLQLLSTWPHFQHVAQLLKASTAGAWLSKSDILWRLLKVVKKKKPDVDWDLPEKDDCASILAILCQDSPKVRTLIGLLGDQVVKNKEKAIVWTVYPAQQVLLQGVMQLLHIDGRCLSANLKEPQRQELIRTFTEKNNELMVLICCFAVNSCGLNLQSKCHQVHLWDPPPSDPIAKQAIGRSRRIGQTHVVEVYEYFMENTFNSRHVGMNLAKALPAMMAELNRGIFDQSTGIVGKDEDSDLSINIGAFNMTFGEYRLWNGRLVRPDDPRFEGKSEDDYPFASPEEILMALLQMTRGTTVVVHGHELAENALDDFLPLNGDGEGTVAMTRQAEALVTNNLSEDDNDSEATPKKADAKSKKTDIKGKKPEATGKKTGTTGKKSEANAAKASPTGSTGTKRKVTETENSQEPPAKKPRTRKNPKSGTENDGNVAAGTANQRDGRASARRGNANSGGAHDPKGRTTRSRNLK